MIEKEALQHIFANNKTILMVGSKGDGKTNGISVVLETLIEELGYEAWTNAHYFSFKNIPVAIEKGKLAESPIGHEYIEKPQQIHVVSKLSETLLGIINSGPRCKITILDEAGIHASSGRSTSRETNTIKDLNKIIRHFESCFVLIAQVETDVPPNLREKECDYRLEMKKKGKHYVLEIGKKQEIKDDDTGKKYIDFPVVKRFRMPLSKYPIDSLFPTGYEIDINLKETLDRLSEIGDSVEIMDKGHGERIIREMLEETDKKKKPKATVKNDIMSEFYNETKLTLKALSKKYKTSYSYVRALHSEYMEQNE